MALRSPLLAAALLAVLPLAGCEHADPLESNPEATFQSIQDDIFSRSCALSGCHVGGNAPFGLDLSEGRAYDNLVGIRSQEVPSLFRIEPGNPDDSYLVLKIEGSPRIADGTGRMPLGRDPLAADQIAAVRAWVADGALRN